MGYGVVCLGLSPPIEVVGVARNSNRLDRRTYAYYCIALVVRLKTAALRVIRANPYNILRLRYGLDAV